MTLSAKQREVLKLLQAAERGSALYLREIGNLQIGAAVEIDGRIIPRGGRTVDVLEREGLVKVDRHDHTAPAYRIFVTTRGRDAFEAGWA